MEPTPAQIELQRRFEEARVIAVITLDRAEDAAPLGRALEAGGVRAVELALRTDAGLPALRALKQACPKLLVGAGTVLFEEQVGAVLDAGADFAVSPGTNPRIVAKAREAGLAFAPGVCTPTDIELAVGLGCRLLKFFPAAPSGGLDFLNSAAAPYAHLGLRYVPLGGIKTPDISGWLKNPHVVAVGGSTLSPKDLIKEGLFDMIEARARETMATLA
jgi:2-dehydro-3-deoxyphosphogluconate aldolase/(4S)-4-hydroxy-2-oxoglutarate aldolase